MRGAAAGKNKRHGKGRETRREKQYNKTQILAVPRTVRCLCPRRVGVSHAARRLPSVLHLESRVPSHESLVLLLRAKRTQAQQACRSDCSVLFSVRGCTAWERTAGGRLCVLHELF